MVFRREVPGSQIIAVRGEGMINASITQVSSAILDDQRATEWVDSLVESKLIKMYGPHEFLEYNHIGTPFVLKDRDFLVHGKVEANLKSGTLTITMASVEDPAVPPGKYIRGHVNGHWNLTSMGNGTQTFLVVEMHADPKGNVPRWIVNLFQKSWPRNTIEKLRMQSVKPDIKVLPQIAAIFEPVKPVTKPTQTSAR